MKQKQFVTYCRVSTKTQGIDGLGIAAQTDSVVGYVKKENGEIVGQFSETESGAKNDRPQLMAALAMCKKTKATLLVARLDRLSRDSAFLISLKRSEVEFLCVDIPECDKFTISLFAILAEREREIIGDRTRLALQAAKKRGIQLGTRNPDRQVALMNAGTKRAKEKFQSGMKPLIEEIQNAGVKTLRGIADCLSRRGIKTRTGKSNWHPMMVKNILTA